MKKQIYFLISLFALIGFSMNVMGQGTGINPAVGSIHTYTVTAVNGATYEWKVTTDENFSSSAENLLVAEKVVKGTSSTNSISLTWLNPDVAKNTIYYLHLQVVAGGCKNNKSIAIQPKNAFKLDIANVNAAGTDIEDNYSVCAPDITISKWNGTAGADAVTTSNKTDFKYNYGQSVFYYKIKASGINVENTSWTPSIKITKTGGDHSTYTVETVVGGTAIPTTWGTTIALQEGENTPTISAGNGNDVLWVKVTVSNGNNTTALANENIVNNDFTFLLEAASKDQHDNPATFDNNTTTQTQKARPNTGEIIPD